MPAAIVQLADAVVADLNAATFSQPFTAQRSYLPRWKLEELATIRVTVVPKDDVGERASRAQWQEDYQLDVAIQQRLGANETAQMDALVLLGQELADYFKSRNPAGDLATLVAVAFAPLFDPDHLEKHKTLTTVLNLTFRGWRP
ncbi:MAG TPA: hypothetical protein PK308_08205 [Phycisphaerales bacterium]|jgi:hypothetical protein|nr:hypothetical protein [Phycisphaerales bacterium]